MTTKDEQLLKNEHDAWYANYIARKNAANIEYIAMMADIDIDEDEDEGTEPEMEEE